MTLVLKTPARGASNWGKNSTNGLDAMLSAIIDEVNGLVLAGITGGNIFDANVQTSATSITLNSAPSTLQSINFTASGQTLTLPSATTYFYDGGVIAIYNNGANAFDVDDADGGSIISSLGSGELATIYCEDASDDAGTWRVSKPLNNLSEDTTPQLGGDLDVNGNDIVSVSNGDINILPNGTGAVNLQDKPLERSKLIDTSETAYSVGNVSGAVVLDYTDGHYQYATATGNITSLTINNLPATGSGGYLTLELAQDGTGNRTIALSSAYNTVEGAGITLSTGASDVDVLRFETRDGGTNINAFINTNMS